MRFEIFLTMPNDICVFYLTGLFCTDG